MKRFLYLMITAACVCAASPAISADMGRPVYKAMEPRAIPAWAGFYLGIQGGYGWGDDTVSINGLDPIASTVVATGAVPANLKTDSRGFVIGGNFGYNWQAGAFVFGPEIAFNYSDIGGGDSQRLDAGPLGLPAILTTSTDSALEWYGRATAKLGVVLFDRALLYVDGGGAFGRVSNSAAISLSGPGAFNGLAASSVSGTEFGWTVGGGVETMLANNWRLKAGYEYLDFGSVTMPMNATVAGTDVSFVGHQKNTFHVAKVGLSKGF